MSIKQWLVKYKVWIIFAVSLGACLFRAFKGFCWTDESFYLSTADRFLKGDTFLVTEWYRTQLSSVICLPFYWLYVTIAGSNTGVILYFRMLFLVLSYATAIVGYRTIKKQYPEGVAVITAIFIMFYAHLNITALSYYMMSLEFLLIALFIIYDYAYTRSKKRLIVAGASFALSVMSLPSFAVAYFAVIGLICIILIVVKIGILPDKWEEVIRQAEFVTIALYTMAGIAIPAVIFAIYMFANASIADIIAAVPYIMFDNEHSFTFGFCFRRFFFAVSDVFGKWTYVAYMLMLLSFIECYIVKKKVIKDCIVVIDIVVLIQCIIRAAGHTGYIQTVLCLFCFPLFLLTNKKNWRMFWLFVPSGLSLAMTYSFSSSDFLYVLAIGHFVAAVGCVAFAYDYVQERMQEAAEDSLSGLKLIATRIICAVIVVGVVYTAGVTVYLRMTNVYRDAPVSKLNCKITQGVGKGLYTTKEHLEYYDEARDMIEQYCMSTSEGNDADDTIMFSKILPWGYMYTDLKCGYPTTWRATAYNAEQLEAYYDMNRNKEPDIIVVLKEYYGSYDACGDVEDDHNPNLDEMNDYWKDYIARNNMVRTEVTCGYVYKMP